MIPRTHPVMSELKDEDKWLKFFTVKQLIYYGVAIAIGVGLTVLLHRLFHAEVIGFMVIIINVCLAFLLQKNIPNDGDKYIIGGGMPLQTILIRLLKKRLKRNRVIYVKNYDASIEGAKERNKKHGNSRTVK